MTASAVFTPCTDEELSLLEAEVELNNASLRLLQSVIRAKLPAGTKLVAMMLCCHHNKEFGAAWPSPDRLAKLCGMHRRTIVDHLATLKNMGLALVGKIPGVRTPAYALQENAVQAIAIDGIKWAKNMLGSAEFMQPTMVQNAARTMVNPAKNAGITIQGTEGTGDLKELGGTEGTDARATPEPTSPALFASQPQKPEQPTAVDASAFAQLVDRINAQRASNGKKPFVLADLHQLRSEAAKSGITPEAAAQWILERSGRNFFKSDYFAPPAPAPVAPTAPAQPAPQPAPAPVLTPEQSAEQEAAAAAARAKLKAMFAQPASAPAPALATPATTTTLTVGKTGQAWADDIMADALAGKAVRMRPLELACQLAKVSYSEVRAAQKSAAATLAAA